MKAYVDFWHEDADDHVVSGDRILYGDWLAPEGSHVEQSLLATFAHYQTTEMVAKAAAVLGKASDAETYGARTEAIAEAFNEEFFHPETSTYGQGLQKSFALPLFAGIVPDERVDAVVETFVEKIEIEDDGKLQTGFVSTRPLIFGLVEHGHEELAYHIVSQPEQPGWVYMVRQGATTLWERWDAPEHCPSMNSRKHRNWPLISEWFYRVLAGINAAEPGFEHVEIAPRVVGDLEWAEGSTETARDEVASRWERTEDGLTLDATVPWNSTGTVRVPDLGADAVRLRENGRVVWHDLRDGDPGESLPEGIEAVSRMGAAVVLEVGSGTYEFALDRLDDSEDGQDDEENGSGPGEPTPPPR